MSDPYDTDDRVRCRCRHYPMSAFEADPKRKDGKVRCLNVTRHPSGRCGDCRRARQQALHEDEITREGRAMAQGGLI